MKHQSTKYLVLVCVCWWGRGCIEQGGSSSLITEALSQEVGAFRDAGLNHGGFHIPC